MKTALPSKVTPKVKKKIKVDVAFLGHPDIGSVEARALGKKYLEALARKYNVQSIVTIRDDPWGKVVRKLARKLLFNVRTFDIQNDLSQSTMANYRQELTVGSIMWVTNRLILALPEGKKRAYSEMARPMCIRMHRKYLIAQI